MTGLAVVDSERGEITGWERSVGAVTVAVDFSALSDQTRQQIDALGLESRVVLRLIEEGFAVSAPYAKPDVAVKLTQEGDALRLTASGGGGEESATVALAAGTAKELQLEIAQKIVELSRSRVAAVQHARDVANAPGPLKKAPPPPPNDGAQAPEPPLRFDLSLGAGVLWRSEGPDPLVAASFAIMGSRDAGLALQIAYDKPTGPDLVIDELQIAIGPRLGLLRSRRWEIDVGLAAGAFGHFYRYTGDAPLAPSGSTVTFVGLLPMSVRFKLGDIFRVGLELAPGIGYAQLHEADGTVIWQRGASRLQSSLAGSVVF